MHFGGNNKSNFDAIRSDDTYVKPKFTKNTIFYDPCLPDDNTDCPII